MSTLPTLILDSLGVVALIGGTVAILMSKTAKENTLASTELIVNLEKLRKADTELFNKRITELEQRNGDNLILITNLQGQLNSIKDVPLQDLAKSMKAISKDTRANALNNAKILQTLLSSATLLVENTQNIANKTEQVKDDLARENENASNAVRIVKEDLKKK